MKNLFGSTLIMHERFVMKAGIYFSLFIAGSNAIPLINKKSCSAIVLLILLFLSPLSGFSQQQGHCGTDLQLLELLKESPELKNKMEQIENHTRYLIQNNDITGTSSDTADEQVIITIPIVFHIIYNTDMENIPESEILLLLESLNKDFRRLNADTGNTRDLFKSIAADTRIEFRLASTDPNGYLCNGITRTFTYKSSFTRMDEMKFDSLGGKNGWPAEDYFNVWICSYNGGYAYYPGLTGSNKALDGVVLSQNHFNNIFYRGLTHETGHYLNLRHIWGDGDCQVDDLVDDTPLAGQANSGTPTDNPNSCTEANNDMPDMHENYMDYTASNATNIFTIGQSERMRALFETGGYRNSLLSSNGCDTGNSHPCPPPGNITYQRVSNNVVLSWDTVSGISYYNLRINDGSSTWTVDSVASTSYTIPNISTCRYIVEIGSVCSDSSAYNTSQNILLVPDSMRVSFASRSTTFSWRAIPGVNSYVLNYRKKGASTWTTVSNISSNSKSVKNLTNNASYQWRVRSSCNSNDHWSKIIDFVVGDNNECPKVAAMAVSNYGETLNQLAWSPSPNAEDYTIRIRPADSTNWTINYTNNNYMSVSNIGLCSGFEFQVESNCPATSSGFSSSHNFTSSGCCTQPGSISVNDISGSSANIAWSQFWPSTNAVKYHVRIREKGASGWITDSTTNTTYNYVNLDSCTEYEVEIESVCHNALSSYTSAINFKTTGCTSACTAPTGLFVSNINKKNARLNWNTVSGATSYEASYWITGSSSVKTVTTTSTQVSINGLNISSIYEWRVRANCTNTWSDYSISDSFEAGLAGSEAYWQEDDQTLSDIENPDSLNTIRFNISPNPTTGQITVYFESTNLPLTLIRIMDMQGRIIMQIDNNTGNTFARDIDLSHLAGGVYMVQVLNNNSLLKSVKIIKAE